MAHIAVEAGKDHFLSMPEILDRAIAAPSAVRLEPQLFLALARRVVAKSQLGRQLPLHVQHELAEVLFEELDESTPDLLRPRGGRGRGVWQGGVRIFSNKTQRL